MAIRKLNLDVAANRGITGGWPADMTYTATDDGVAVQVEITDAGKATDSIYKIIDPWGLAFVHEVQQITDKPLRVKFSLRVPATVKLGCKHEALKRRLSYLAASSGLDIELDKDGEPDPLYSLEELFQRPEGECVRTTFVDRNGNDKPGRLEKDFQVYLFGPEIEDGQKTVRNNGRLAIFGDDFIRVGKVKNQKDQRGFNVQREFPTGAFAGEIREANRILPTEFVDLVTVNRNREIAIIELKFDDPKIEVLSQVLNYALFFKSYRAKLTPLLNEKLGIKGSNVEMVTYLVSNVFHNKFKTVWKYYTNGPLRLKRVVMGHMPD
ncbi:hypothetical protein [Geomonas anaerohicana]|uniref:Uncharacterized protein n=1 Tax=Geomonas anaerohicana TaxID=2798583 RepID=A0ABS0YEL4_9BACT|nr:hypothetical protein [Geomonas anaerohicana]MBJ6750747.1 hypothetical protein [Geomonas anaerohicana]